MKVSNKAFADFLNVNIDEIETVRGYAGDYEVVLNNKTKYLVTKTDLILFIYDKLIEYCSK
jgi:hypothetical protein